VILTKRANHPSVPASWRWLRHPAAFLLLLTLALTATASGGADSATPDTERPRATPPAPTRQPQAVYSIEVGVDGEVYPVFANYAALQPPQERTWSTVAVKISNSSGATLRNRVSVQIRGWSDEEIQIAEMSAGETRTYLFAPSFLPRFYRNRDLTAATAVVTATDMSGHVVYSGTAPVRLRAVDDILWGDGFKNSRFIASWVTPHDPRVEDVLSKAKEFMPGRRLPGYENWKSPAQQAESTRAQARAIYRALQKKGVSYVKSSITFGRHTATSERVRMPWESLRQVSANCIDGAVMYASLFENLGMDPVVILVPGHAYVGVRTSEEGRDFLYLDAAVIGRASFETSVDTAEQGMARLKPAQITRIAISEARSAGIFPMPGFDSAAATPGGATAATRLR